MPDTITRKPFQTTGQLAAEFSEAYGVDYHATQWRIRRIFEDRTVSEPCRVGGRRIIIRAMIPPIVAALVARDWLPAEALQDYQAGAEE